MDNIAVVVSNDNKNVTPFDTINAIKKAGFKKVFVQWYDNYWNPSQQEQLNYIKENNLEVLFAHLGYQDINNIWLDNEKGNSLVTRYKNDIKTCKDNNVKLVIMHLTSKNNAPKYNEIGLKRIKEIIDYAISLDVKIAFENTRIKGH